MRGGVKMKIDYNGMKKWIKERFKCVIISFVMIEGNTFDKEDSEVDSDEYTGEIR